jgi:hypothetical protein
MVVGSSLKMTFNGFGLGEGGDFHHPPTADWFGELNSD